MLYKNTFTGSFAGVQRAAAIRRDRLSETVQMTIGEGGDKNRFQGSDVFVSVVEDVVGETNFIRSVANVEEMTKALR